MEWSEVSDTSGEPEYPESITVVKAISYSTEEVLYALQEAGEYPHPTFENIIDLIAKWASEDFGCQWGHPTNAASLTFLDQDGNVIYLGVEEE